MPIGILGSGLMGAKLGTIFARAGHEMEELAGWESFHVIVAAAAAVLIGLQFVAMALIADAPGGRRNLAGKSPDAAFRSML
jgi:hypothetical protein